MRLQTPTILMKSLNVLYKNMFIFSKILQPREIALELCKGLPQDTGEERPLISS